MSTQKIINEFTPLIGKWSVRGTSFVLGDDRDSLVPSSVPWEGFESYEWLDGKKFIVHKWFARIGDKGAFNGIEIIGVNSSAENYISSTFDNHGNSPCYMIDVNREGWNFISEWTRATIKTNVNNDELDIKWEWLDREREWKLLCERIAKRIAD